MDLMRAVEVESEHLAHFQNEMDSMRTVEVESEHLAHSQNEMDSIVEPLDVSSF
jgi:hypothetical protein